MATNGGRLILLNGPSSSGKTSLAEALHKRLDETYYRASIDTFVHNMLDRERHIAFNPPDASTALQGFYLRTVVEGGHRSLVLNTGPLAKRFIFGMHAAVAAFVSAGNNLIFDDVLYDPAYLENYLRVLEGIEVLFVGVCCPLDVLEQRERQRGDRAIGHARGHYGLVHAHHIYDIEIDTSVVSPEDGAEQIKSRLYGDAPFAFRHLREQSGRL
jgi:chloramphenicol 3-O phosphotransferase